MDREQHREKIVHVNYGGSSRIDEVDESQIWVCNLDLAFLLEWWVALKRFFVKRRKVLAVRTKKHVDYVQKVAVNRQSLIKEVVD